MSEDTIRIGFIGAGGIARQQHLPRIAKIGGAEVVAVCNRSRESGEQVAKDFDIAEVVTDWRSLLEREDIDAIFIGTWPYMHREMSVASLDAGKHTFCQARMSNDLEEAKAMADAARNQPELVNMICPPPHRMPWEPYIRHMIEADELGEIREVRLLSINASNADAEKVTWREQVEYSGKQALQMGIWAETLNAWVGPYRKLSATTATPIPRKRADDGSVIDIRIPQVVVISGELERGGVIGEHHSGVSLHEAMNFVSIYGSKGTLRVDAMERIQFGRAGRPLEPVDVPADMQRPWRVEQDFVDAVRAARRGESWTVSPDFDEGLLYMRKVEAVHRAAETGQAVNPAEL